MIAHDPVEDRIIIPCLLQGVVTDNADPEGLGRIRFQIPGLIEPESDWSYPTGTFAGGGSQRGAHAVPDIGATVDVLFIGGDPQFPKWMASHWGVRPDTGSEMPVPAKAAGAEAHRIACAQFGRFLFAVDERDDKLVFKIEGVRQPETPTEAPTTEDVGVGLELDLKNKQLALTATVGIILKTLGIIHLDGSTIRLRDRLLGTKAGAV